MGILGTDYDSFGDMVDGGGPGQSGNTFDNDNDPNNEVTGIASISNSLTGNSHANDGYGDDNSSGKSSNYQPYTGNETGENYIDKILGFTPVGIIGKVAGWANGLDKENDKLQDVGDTKVYTNKDGFTYSYNFLGLPYEVEVVGDSVKDALQKDANGKYPGDEGYDRSTSRYSQMAAEARANGDNETAAAIEQEAAQNSGDVSGYEPLGVNKILEWAQSTGVVSSNEEIEALIKDPNKFFADRGMLLSDIIKENLLDPNADGTVIDGSNPKYNFDRNTEYDVNTVTDENVEGYTAPTNEGSSTYEVDKTSDNIMDDRYNADAITGEFKDGYGVNADDLTIDMEGAATGTNADGTRNYVGEALNKYATQNTSNVIDTSTAGGKLLALSLGEGNYLDSKATILGQMELISKEFVDSQGNPKIPSWAQGLYRNLSRSVGFNGVSGTAAMATYSNAIMEASLGIAKDEATFFQTLTTKNLDNRQEAFINKAVALASFEELNVDVKTKAAISNARNFLDLDMQNLSAENEAMIINIGNRVDALFEDSKQENLMRRFFAESENELAMYYDGLEARASEHYADAINTTRRFNAGELNDAAEFMINADMRYDEFQADMQFQIDKAVTDWKQKVALTNFEAIFDAASEDVGNMYDLTSEGMNRVWDRVDSLLDYVFKGATTMEELEVRLLLGEMQASAQNSGGNNLLTTLINAGSTVWAAKIASSDARLKENIQPYEVHKGVQFYTWDWNQTAKDKGLDTHPTFGVIAQEVQKTHPETVVEGEHGYLMVNYGKLINEI